MTGQPHPDSESILAPQKPQFLRVGAPPDERPIAFLRRAPAHSGRPGVVWFCGYNSDMASTKASALDEEAARRGFALLRFDYSGHGLSGGRFEDSTISRWLEESLAVVREQSEGPQILVGSSMGGYLALLAARALHEAGEDGRLAGMILIAPAVDMTEALMWANLPDEGKRAIIENGAWARPSAYSPEPYLITRRLIEDGRGHLMLDRVIRTYCPVSILQGMRDDDVPYKHSLALMERLVCDPATLTLVRDGDHRLSRPQDIALMIETLGRHLA